MFGLGFSEIVVIGILALILLGPDQLPDLARTLGRFINDLRRTTDGLKEEFKNSGLSPHSLLEDIQRDRPKNPPEPDMPPEAPQDVEASKPHHPEPLHQTTETNESEDSGKKSDTN